MGGPDGWSLLLSNIFEAVGPAPALLLASLLLPGVAAAQAAPVTTVVPIIESNNFLAPAGSTCTLTFERLAQPIEPGVDCRVQITCGLVQVYGGPTGGYLSCGGDASAVWARDDVPDSDNAVILSVKPTGLSFEAWGPGKLWTVKGFLPTEEPAPATPPPTANPQATAPAPPAPARTATVQIEAAAQPSARVGDLTDEWFRRAGTVAGPRIDSRPIEVSRATFETSWDKRTLEANLVTGAYGAGFSSTGDDRRLVHRVLRLTRHDVLLGPPPTSDGFYVSDVFYGHLQETVCTFANSSTSANFKAVLPTLSGDLSAAASSHGATCDIRLVGLRPKEVGDFFVSSADGLSSHFELSEEPQPVLVHYRREESTSGSAWEVELVSIELPSTVNGRPIDPATGWFDSESEGDLLAWVGWGQQQHWVRGASNTRIVQVGTILWPGQPVSPSPASVLVFQFWDRDDGNEGDVRLVGPDRVRAEVLGEVHVDGSQFQNLPPSGELVLSTPTTGVRLTLRVRAK